MRVKSKEKSRTWKVKSLGVATLLTITFSFSTVTAQESINAIGGDASGSGGSVSYSVGQIVYQTHADADGSVAQGVQQPYEISTITGIEETAINLAFSAYPNPTTDYLTLQVDVSTELSINLMSYQLYDMNGKLLQNEKIVGNQTRIVMINLLPSTYFVRVMEGIKKVKTFKIIKN